MNSKFIFHFIVLVILTANTFAQSREIAVTIDDLPVVSGIQDKKWLNDITDSLLHHLAEYGIPATGFVIKNKVINGDSTNEFQLSLLKRWLHAGMDLGNHTYSHKSLNKVGPDEYIEDISKGEELFSQIEEGYKPELFRHPFLQTGRDSVSRAAVESYLADKGYKIATVTIDNADYIFARAYENSIKNKDEENRDRIADDYISYMEKAVEFYENQSKLILGYEIKQILLIHSNKLNADLLGELAQMLIRRGYKFISVKEALSDPAYKTQEDRYFGPAGISWLHRWALTQGKRGEFFKGEPEVPEFVNQIAEE